MMKNKGHEDDIKLCFFKRKLLPIKIVKLEVRLMIFKGIYTNPFNISFLTYYLPYL